MEKRVKQLEKELKCTRRVLGTLIAWLVQELGESNAKELIRDLQGDGKP